MHKKNGALMKEADDPELYRSQIGDWLISLLLDSPGMEMPMILREAGRACIDKDTRLKGNRQQRQVKCGGR